MPRSQCRQEPPTVPTDRNAPAADTTQTEQSTGRPRRHELQRQCLVPCSLSAEARTQSWLDLLDISAHDISRRALELSKQTVDESATTSAQASDIVKDSISASIPLDKDGWQVANQELISADADVAAGADQDGWKVVKSKRSRRHLAADQADRAETGESTQSSIAASEATMSVGCSSPARSTSSRSSDAHVKDGASASDGLAQSDSAPLTSQQRFANLSAHDIEQVAKDVERSFIGPAFQRLFAPNSPGDDEKPTISAAKAWRRAQLSHLVLTTLNAHPCLHYFQGYHDILSVVVLTCAPELPASCSRLFADEREQATVELLAERLSLHVIRDSMARDLLPVMGQLRVVGRVVQLADARVSELMERASPMPFFALAWLLTLLTHDAADVGVMQRVVDFVLAYGPAAAIYLCAAIPLVRSDEILAMDDDVLQDAAMLHTVLGRLPSIVAEVDEHSEAEEEHEEREERQAEDGMYTDPDVELPSLASDRALADRKEAAPKSKPTGGIRIRICTLLQKAVELMHAHPLTSRGVRADTIMGDASVLFTWSSLFDASSTTSDCRVDWPSQTACAHAILCGPTDAIVVAPHAPQPHPHPHPHPDGRGKCRENDTPSPPPSPSRAACSNHDEAHHSQMLALVGISGLLVAALFTAATQTRSSAISGLVASSAAADDTKRAIALVVSLLSDWGRVVGGRW